MVAKVYRGLNDPEIARFFLSKAFKLEPTNFEVTKAFAEVSLELSNLVDAEKAVMWLRTVKRNDPETLRLSAELDKRLNKDKKPQEEAIATLIAEMQIKRDNLMVI